MTEIGEQIQIVKKGDLSTYQERRNKIQTSDNELISYALVKGMNYSDSTVGNTRSVLLSESRIDYFKTVLNEKPFIDLGCGQEGIFNVLILEENFKLGKMHLVDPFMQKAEMDERIRNYWKLEKLPDQLKTKIIEKVDFQQKDGLSFLLSLKDEYANIMVNSINYSLIKNDDYLKRIAQEFYRVNLKNGVCIVCDSSEIEHEAKILFPYFQEFGVVTVFSKSPIPTNDELYRQLSQKRIKKLKESVKKPIDKIILSKEEKNNLMSECIRLLQRREPVEYWITITERKLELQESFHDIPFHEELKKSLTYDLNFGQQLKNKTQIELKAFLRNIKDDKFLFHIRHSLMEADVAINNEQLKGKTNEEIKIYIKTFYCPEYAILYRKLKESGKKLYETQDGPEFQTLLEEREKIRGEISAFKKKVKNKI